MQTVWKSSNSVQKLNHISSSSSSSSIVNQIFLGINYIQYV